MIWVVMLVLIGLIGFYLMQPFLTAGHTEPDPRLAEARAQRAAIDRDAADGRLTEAAAEQARNALDRRVLAMLDAAPNAGNLGDLRSLTLFVVPAVLLLGVAGIYGAVGNPSYERVTAAEFRAAQAAELPQSLDALVVELRHRLEADPNPPADGYVLLARSYLRLNEIEAAFDAYDVAIEISGGDQTLIDERNRVVEILRERAAAPQVGPEAAARIQSMSPDERAAMINSMVDGLAVRLEQNPDDAQGWGRLIRARIVLGQVTQARQDLAAAQSVFADDPDQLALFTPLAAELAQLDE